MSSGWQPTHPGGTEKCIGVLMKRFTKLCFVGGSGVFVDMAVLFMLIDPQCLGISLVYGKLCAGQTAMVNNFIWNDLWTFHEFSSYDPTWRGRLKRFVKFDVVCSFGLVISVILLHIQVVRFGFNPYIANFLAIVVATFWNYGINLCFNWGKENKGKSEIGTKKVS